MILFDETIFDSDIFDCIPPGHVVPTLSRPTNVGWREEVKAQAAWAPGDYARGADWTETSRGQSTFAPGATARGAAWAVKPKGNATW